MALERIDPVLLEDCYAVDHLLRYALAAPLAKGKRVLDAACGLGFGSAMLVHQEATAVVGVDNSGEAIESCRQRWQIPTVEFHQLDLENPGAHSLGSFGLVTSFETLEHVPHPDRVLDTFKAVLDEGGLLFGSVPGRTDLLEDNAFHLQHFTGDSLAELLRSRFANVRIYRQDFSVRSSLCPVEGRQNAEPMQWREETCLSIDFGRAGPKEDTLVFLASDGELPDLDLTRSAASRAAWLRLRGSYHGIQEELNAFAAKYRALFLEHGDLKIKFANMLGWGQWHYEELHGRKPGESEIERIEKATSNREQQLRKQVEELQQELLEMKKRLARAEDLLGPAEEGLKKLFNQGARAIHPTE